MPTSPDDTRPDPQHREPFLDPVAGLLELLDGDAARVRLRNVRAAAGHRRTRERRHPGHSHRPDPGPGRVRPRRAARYRRHHP